MKKNILFLSFFIYTYTTWANPVNKNQPGSITPENTYVLIVGVLEWQSPTLSPFSKKNRKDEELYNLFLNRGVKKENILFLKDAQATSANIYKGLGNLLTKTTPGSTFIFYYAGHGVREANGPVIFANYDYVARKDNGFKASDVGDRISQHFKGNRAWLLADCCYSGVLIEEAKKISSSGKKAIAFTSSTASNASTSNWTFTQTMIDCLSGLPTGDHNADKKISLAETRQELLHAMRYRERQLSGAAFFNTPETETFNITPVSSSSAFKGIMYLYVLNNGKFEPARVLKTEGTSITGELYHYSDKKQVVVSVNITKPIEFAEYPVGMNVEVEWKGTNYPAVIKETSNGFHYIKYTGYDDSWNEWITYDRIYTKGRKKCTVEWQGIWFPAELLQEKGGKYFIHYTGYGNDWDEWVPASRIRL